MTRIYRKRFVSSVIQMLAVLTHCFCYLLFFRPVQLAVVPLASLVASASQHVLVCMALATVEQASVNVMLAGRAPSVIRHVLQVRVK